MDVVSQNLENLIRSYKHDELVEEILPAIYVIEPTNVCNLNCLMCPNSEMTDKGFMSFGLFRQITDQIKASAKTILLYFTGEPLLHKKIIEMIKLCKKETKANVIVSTNATVLDSGLSQELIGSGLDTLVVSIDGNSKETYKKIKQGAKFENVCNNILNFIDIKKNKDNPELYVKLIRMKQNRNEIDDFIKRWQVYPCKILISDLSSWAGQFFKLYELMDNVYLGPKKSHKPCADLWFKMIINYRGDVVQCCYDFGGKHILGNVRLQRICEIWNSDLMRNIRKIHKENKYYNIPLCKSCREWSDEEDEYQYFPEYRSFIGGRP